MCWMSNRANCLNSGDRKIPVIKVLRMQCDLETLEAYYRGNLYTLDKEYTETIEVKRSRPLKSYIINAGLHCYSNKCKVERESGGICVYISDSDSMFYPDNKILPSLHPYKSVVVEGYIPPNTEYYLNKDQEIVTSKLVLTKILSIT